MNKTTLSPFWYALPFVSAILVAYFLGQSFMDVSIDQRQLYPLKTAIVAILMAAAWPYIHELRFQSAAVGRHWLTGILVGVGVFVAWINLDHSWIIFDDKHNGYLPLNGNGIDWYWVTIRLMGSALLVPIVEEIFWRSFVTRWLQSSDFLSVSPSKLKLAPIVISAILFGLAHSQWFAGILAGLAYGWLYRYSGCLWVPIAAHAITNAMLGVWVVYSQNWQFW